MAEKIKFYIESLFRLIGIDFAAEGEKAPPYDQVFRSLGLQFDLCKISDGYFTLGHTESRRRELLEQIEIMTEGDDILVNVKELERLHGRLVWFNAFVFGRTLKAAVRVISNFSRSPSKRVKVDGPLRDALTVLKAELAKDEPVLVQDAVTRTWTIFTDGAYEPDGAVKASIGGVLVNEDGLVVECFGIELGDSLREDFLADSQHPIYELELFPVLVALRTWQHHLNNAQVVFYLDNDAARSALIRGNGSTLLSQVILSEFLKLERDTRILPWFSKVPTASNPADDASRLIFNVPWLLGVPRPELILPARLSQWGYSKGAANMMQCGNSGNGSAKDQKQETDLMDESSKPSRMNLPIQTFSPSD